MNLNHIVSGAISAINPPTQGTVMVSSGGYTTSPDGTRVSNYAGPQTAMMQVQALTVKDIYQVDALNIAGSTHTVYVNGRLDGLIRTDNKGGDLLTFNGRTWLVKGVLEDWPDWCKVAVTLQNGS